MKRQPDLLQVIAAGDASGGLAGGLHRRQQQRDQDADDRDDHQQLDQRKARRCASCSVAAAWPMPHDRPVSAHCLRPQAAVRDRSRRAQQRSGKRRRKRTGPGRRRVSYEPTTYAATVPRNGPQSRAGRSSGSRVRAGPAFSPRLESRQWPNRTGLTLIFTRLQRRGRPGFAPGSLFVGPSTEEPTTNARRNSV